MVVIPLKYGSLIFCLDKEEWVTLQEKLFQAVTQKTHDTESAIGRPYGCYDSGQEMARSGFTNYVHRIDHSLTCPTLEYVKGQSDLVATLACVVSSKDANTIQTYLTEDHFLGRSPIQPVIQDSDPVQRQGSRIADLNEFRERKLSRQYPAVRRSLLLNCPVSLCGVMTLAEEHHKPATYDIDHLAACHKEKWSGQMDNMFRIPVMHNMNTPSYRRPLLDILYFDICDGQWLKAGDIFMQIVEKAGLAGCQEFSGILDMVLCGCIQTLVLSAPDEAEWSSEQSLWPYLSRLSNADLRARVLLGILPHLDVDVGIAQIRLVLAHSGSVSRSGGNSRLTDILKKRLAELTVYKKVRLMVFCTLLHKFH